MKQLCLKFLYTVLLTLSSAITLADSNKLTAYTEDLYPLSYKDQSNGKITGAASDILHLVLKEQSIDYQLNIVPWARSYANTLNKPNHLLYSVARTPEREDKFIWLFRILDLHYGLYTTDENLKNATLKDLQELYISVTRNGLSHQVLTKKGFKKFIFIDENEKIGQLINRNRVKIFFTSSMWISHFKSKLEQRVYLIPDVKIEDATKGMYFALNKKSSPELITKLVEGFQHIEKTGEYQEILARYQLNEK